MNRRRSWKKRILARVFGILGVPALLLFYFLSRDQWQAALDLQGSAAPTSSPDLSRGELRIVTWNLRNFGVPPEKVSGQQKYENKQAKLRRKFAELSASILALQEVRNPDALHPLLPNYQLWFSSTGGRGAQYLGFAYNPEHVELVDEPIEHLEISLKGRLRPAVSARFRTKHRSFDFRIIVVHLKAGPEGYNLRRSQWQRLIDKIEEIDRSPHRDPDLFVVGDFNTTGPKQGSSAKEVALLDQTLAKVGLHRIENETGCSAYWDGPKRDAWKESSRLDFIWASRSLQKTHKFNAKAFAQCARHQCQAFRSTKAYPDPDFAIVSDHCPVVVDLAPTTSMSLHHAHTR